MDPLHKLFLHWLFPLKPIPPNKFPHPSPILTKTHIPQSHTFFVVNLGKVLGIFQQVYHPLTPTIPHVNPSPILNVPCYIIVKPTPLTPLPTNFDHIPPPIECLVD